MTETQSQQIKTVTLSDGSNERWALSDVAQLMNCTEKQAKATGANVVGQFVELKRQNEKIEEEKERFKQKAQNKTSNSRIKETALDKFKKKANGRLGIGSQKYLLNLLAGYEYIDVNDTTGRYMKHYGSHILAAMYQMGLLSDTMNEAIENITIENVENKTKKKDS